MTLLDYLVASLEVILLMAAGFWFTRRGGKSSGEFMLGGRKLPWWLAGTAMVAGSSSADSPLHQSGKIRRDGLPGAWFYWSQVFGQVFQSIVFSRLWRRAEITTVVEFYALRYEGPARTLGRLWAMGVAALVEGTIGLAISLLAMIKISTVLLGLDAPVVIAGLSIPPGLLIALAALAAAIAYSVAAGLLGVVAGDMVEFLLAMLGSYLLMWYVYREVGYSAGLAEGLSRLGREAALSFTPALGLSALAFFVLQPLATLPGSNATNQRFLALRDEREAMLSGIWRVINHFFFRCWPWYICGLCSLVLLPDLSTPAESAYPTLIARYLPPGLRGLMFGGFVVAFMGYASAIMHNSGTIFINDFYRAYLVPRASDRHYVWAVRGAMLIFTAGGIIIALASTQILGLLQLLIMIVSAAGLVLILRWFWWRVNGWADLSAQVLALPVTLFYTNAEKWLGAGRDPVTWVMHLCGGRSADDRFAAAYLLIIATTTLVWLVVMSLTPPEPMDRLVAFYRRVRPYGWWGPVRRACPDVVCPDSFRHDLFLYVLGLGLALSLLFGFGLLLLGHWFLAVSLLLGGGWCGRRLVRSINARHG